MILKPLVLFEVVLLLNGLKNPEVDSFLGRKLSQVSLRRGAKYQRKALVADPSHLPSKLQLAQDLLRLGNEDEGWELVLK